jgi:hypothetical protein
MTYILQRLAPGSFDLILDGKIVGSLVRDISEDGHEGDWMAEALDDSPPYPAPFERAKHAFPTLLGAAKWLDATVPDL